MNMQQHNNWEPDDFELEQEFEDVSNIVRKNQTPPPKVPRRLDRLIRKYATGQSGDQLQNNWLLGSGLQLALVVLLLFVIGMMFISSLEQTIPENEAPTHPVIQRES